MTPCFLFHPAAREELMEPHDVMNRSALGANELVRLTTHGIQC
jgi:hypothetical protein